jgi:hypothetical protein
MKLLAHLVLVIAVVGVVACGSKEKRVPTYTSDCGALKTHLAAIPELAPESVDVAATLCTEKKLSVATGKRLEQVTTAAEAKFEIDEAVTWMKSRR